MRLGDAELAIIRTILTNLTAGDEEGAKERACEAVSNWLSANKLHNRLRDEDVVWAALMRNVFPNAPRPTQHEPHLPESRLPVGNKEWFYAMCNRYRHLRLTEEAFKRLRAERDEAERENYELEGYLESFMQDNPGFFFYEFARKEEPAPDDADPQLKAEWKRVTRAFRKARRRWFVLDDRVRRRWDDVLDARNFVREWVPSPALLKPKREPARPCRAGGVAGRVEAATHAGAGGGAGGSGGGGGGGGFPGGLSLIHI